MAVLSQAEQDAIYQKRLAEKQAAKTLAAPAPITSKPSAAPALAAPIPVTAPQLSSSQQLMVTQLVNRATSQGTQNLQQQTWWNQQPQAVKEAAWAEIQKRTSSTQDAQGTTSSYGQSAGGPPPMVTGAQAGAQQGAWIGPTPQAEKAQINAQANQAMESELTTIQSETNRTDLSASAQLTERLIKTLETKQAEPLPSLEQKFLDQRAQLGAGELEDTMASVDAAIAKLDADWTSVEQEEESRGVSMGAIRRRQSALSLEYNRQRRDLVAERTSVANELNVKYGVINSIVKYAGEDINNAQQKYNTEFSQAVQMINMVRNIEQDALSAEEKRITNAQANVQVMTNLLKTGNINYDDLDASTLADIKNMEIQAGFPVGFTSFVHENVPDPVVTTLPSFTDSAGNKIQPIMTKDADGTFSIQNITLGQVGVPGAGTVDNGIPVVVDNAIKAGEKGLTAVGVKTTNVLGSGYISGYGSEAWSEGLDYVLDGGMGAAVITPVSGEVIQVDTGHKKGEIKSFGNRVKVKLSTGEEIWLSHLQGTSVQKGDMVTAGQQIGTQGNTGTTYGATGVHVDVTMKKKGGSYYTAKEVASFLNGVGKTSTGSGAGGIVSKEDFRQMAEQASQSSLTQAAVDNLYNEYLAAAGEGSTGYEKPEESGVEFTDAQKLKLEQAGLLNADRQQQLDHLYGDKDLEFTYE